VAGSNTAWALEPYLILANMNFLSPDSRCFSFDDRANGYARGEGFGVLVLKRLTDALKDGDSIRAVIRSTGSNSDGRTPGITQPSKDAQELLIRETYEKAGLDLKSTRFFEAHGTGTPVGDPIEAGAIGGAFSKYRSPEEPLYVGAVKSNIGHLEGASGVAGVIKAILALEKGVIPPNTNFECPNPRIDAPSLNLRFPLQALPWPNKGLRRASINSFGFGGSNAHAVIDDAFNFLKSRGLSGFHSTVKEPPSSEDLSRTQGLSNPPVSPNGSYSELGTELDLEDSRPSLLVWSAADEGGLDRLAKSYDQHFKALSLKSDQDSKYLKDLAYTLAVRRSVLPWKSFTLTHSMSQLRNAGVSLSKPVRSSRNLGLSYIFTGQGAQFSGMGRHLLAHPVYKTTLQRAELYLQDMGCPWSLMDELLKEKGLSNVNSPEYSQPLCTALQIALIELLRSFNITPSAVVGHSSGEIAAAYCIGALSLRSACKVAYFRGTLAARLAMTSKTRGSMIAVGLPESKVGPYIREVASKFGHIGIVVACINSPKSVTISGDENQVDALRELLEKESVFARKLQVDVAYHSPHMNQIADDYLMAIKDLEMGEPLHGCKLMVSSVVNKPLSTRELCQAGYWVKNMTSAVRFSEAVAQLTSMSAKTQKRKLGGGNQQVVTTYDLLELGPHSALQGPTKDILKTVARGNEVSYSSALSRNVSAFDTVLSAAGRLYCLGYPVKVADVNGVGAKGAKEPSDRMALTDLPEYPFDHSQAYWHESRISKDLRLRKHPRLDLLGTQSLDWNPLEAKWRKFIRLSETPWAADHVVNGAVIYPAAGMLVMALEGARQLSDSDRRVNGYRIKEATFQRALGVPSDQDGVEAQICIRPLQDAFDKNTTKYDFRICSLEDNTWIENCRGTVQLEYDDYETDEIDGGHETAARLCHYRQLHEFRTQKCDTPVDSQVIYDHFRAIGLDFGPAFQTLQNVSCNGDGDVVAEIKAFPSVTKDGANHPQSHLIHPTTLDGLIQLVLVGLTKGAKDVIPATVPTRVTNFWLSASGLSYPQTTSIQASSNHLSRGARQTESSMFAVNKAGNILASVSVLETTNVDQRNADSDSQSIQRQLCYNMDWKPDIDFLDTQQAQAYCEAGKDRSAEPLSFYQDLGLFLFSTISKTLTALEGTKIGDSREQYFQWMRLQVERYEAGKLLHGRPEWSSHLHDAEYQKSLTRRVEASGSEGKFYVEIGRNLLKILHGEVDPVALLFQGDLAKDYYLEINARLSSQFARLMDLLSHKQPGLKVLEVGAGTGGTTAYVIRPLFVHGNEEDGTPRCSRYDFTDISPAFFEKAQEDFKDYNSRMKYRVLDIEKDVFIQGFETGTYDLIVAANVLHATKHLDVTLKNVHALLKPGGRLVLLEQTGDFARGGFAFGLLPGWWLSVDNYRQWGPTMTPQKWDKVLKNNGFSGTDLVLSDYHDATCQELSIIVSMALEPSSIEHNLPKTAVIVTEGSLVEQQIARHIQNSLLSRGSPTCEIVSIEKAAAMRDISESFCVFLAELSTPILADLNPETFLQVKSILSSAQGLLWVTQGGGSLTQAPEYQVVDGLLRTLRTENGMLKAVTLALDGTQSGSEAKSKTILQVLVSAIANKVNDFETEYMEKDGVLYTNRVVEANYINTHVSTLTKPQECKTQPFGAGPALALDFQTPGLLDSLRFLEDKAQARPLSSNEVEIEVRATGVNFMDCLTALGRINQTEIGGECSGVVTRIGSDCDLQPGDRVCGIVFDCFKTYARADWRTVMRIPDELSFVDAAALPMTCTTAYHALIEAGRLQQEDKVLIHAGAGGTGQSAIQISKVIGAEVFVTVGSETKKKLVMELYGIPEDHIFYSRNTTFAQGVMRMTHGRGVDVVLNSLAGDGLSASWECIASFGRFVEIGKRDIHTHTKLDMFHFAKNVSFSAVDIFGMSRERPDLVRKSLSAVMAMVAESEVHVSQPMRTYSVSEVEDAFRYMQSGKNVGKIVVDMKRDGQVLVSTFTHDIMIFAN
jgi:acyl transferase domain-containing protein/NADPH:quinone reductase-like Zn-dependent oxidoreductase/SAM-dependent methyltransferase